MYIDGVRRTCAVENLRDQDWVFHRTLPGSYSTARKQTETYGNNKWNPDITPPLRRGASTRKNLLLPGVEHAKPDRADGGWVTAVEVANETLSLGPRERFV